MKQVVTLLKIRKSLYADGIPFTAVSHPDIVKIIAAANGFLDFYDYLQKDGENIVCYSVGPQSKCEILGIIGGFLYAFDDLETLDIITGSLNTLPKDMIDFRKDPYNEHNLELCDKDCLVIADSLGATSKHLTLLYENIPDIKQIPQYYLQQVLNPLVFTLKDKMDISSEKCVKATVEEIHENMLALEQYKQSFDTIFGNVLPSVDAKLVIH